MRLVANVLKYKPLEEYDRMRVEDLEDYERFKTTILKVYELRPNPHRLHLRGVWRRPTDTCVDRGRFMEEMIKKWFLSENDLVQPLTPVKSRPVGQPRVI